MPFIKTNKYESGQIELFLLWNTRFCFECYFEIINILCRQYLNICSKELALITIIEWLWNIAIVKNNLDIKWNLSISRTGESKLQRIGQLSRRCLRVFVCELKPFEWEASMLYKLISWSAFRKCYCLTVSLFKILNHCGQHVMWPITSCVDENQLAKFEDEIRALVWCVCSV